MQKQPPFSLRIFVVDGDPDGLSLVERSNWIGKAVMFPRAIYPEVRNRWEFQQTGVYLLLGPRPEGDGDTLYIGEGDPVRPRFESHYGKYDFWTRAVFFVAGTGHLNKAHVQYLEARLVALATAAKRIQLDNKTVPTEPTLSEADRADMDVFLANILGMLPVLGIHAFEHAAKPSASATSDLTCQGKGILARGYESPQGFVVKGGSTAVLAETPGLLSHAPRVAELRQELVNSGVLVRSGEVFRFAQDYEFSSPSLAATVVRGSPSNGRVDWKDASGRTLREIQEAQTES